MVPSQGIEILRVVRERLVERDAFTLRGSFQHLDPLSLIIPGETDLVEIDAEILQP